LSVQIYAVLHERRQEQIAISWLHEDLFALSIILDAADTCSTRYGGTGIPGVSPSELEDLHRWIDASERWFFTPLKLKHE
jgi:hypothetical protein